MEKAPPDIAPICALPTSATNSQNVLPPSARRSLGTLNTTLPSDSSPGEVAPSRLLKNPQYRKCRTNFQFQRSNSFFSHWKITIPRKSERTKKDIKSKSRRKSKV
jgi:hypothetical protein